jgi:tyrosyl-tRNA synthetase
MTANPSRNTTLDVFKDSPTLQRTAEEVVTLDDLREKLSSGRKLRIKYGVDVTAPFLHIGHAVNLWAMRELQDAGHKVQFLVGDFTTRIGDPTGRSATRLQIPPEQIERDAEDFIRQVSQILRTDPAVFEVRRNSEWWESMPLSRFMELLSLVTHAKLIQRDMFQRRIERDAEIYMHELLYPILQGYDSYELESDLTIVGTDQLFNELMGRFYQERLDMEPQVVATTAITPGIDGREKQSKSLGNYIALSDTPRDKYGKAMRLRDDLVGEFLRVYTLVPLDEIDRMEASMRAGDLNPMEAKRTLARALVERYHGAETAAAEEAWFTRVFSRRSVPDDVPTITVEDPNVTLLDLLRRCLPSESSSQLRRLIVDGGVRVAGQDRLTDPEQRHPVSSGDVIRVGKRRWFRVVFGPGRR